MDSFAMMTQVGGVAGSIASFLVVLGVVVFVHEFGHYIVARWCGIDAEVFSIGFGKEIWGWNDRRGTRWRLAVLPLGGYVKFVGDGDAASARADTAGMEAMDDATRARSFPGAALWRRALTVAAGPVFNFVLSILIYTGLTMALGVGSDRPVLGASQVEDAANFPLRAGDEILAVAGTPITVWSDISTAYETASTAEPGRAIFPVDLRRDGREITIETGPAIPPLVGSVAPASPAEEAGLLAGDRIVMADGQPVGAFSDLQRVVFGSDGAAVALVVEGADGARREVTLTPKLNPVPSASGGIEMRPLIGVSAIPRIAPEVVTPGIGQALGNGVTRTWQVIHSSLAYVGAIIGGKADSSGLGGPIRIASLSGDAAGAGIVAFLGMIAMISTSIGMINLFPIPVLDGGHLMFYAFEALRGRPLGERATEAATGVGLALVLGLMVFVTFNDLMSL